MKKYRVAALPRMQEGGSKPKKKKSKYDIESTGMFTPEDNVYSEMYDIYSNQTLETGETPTIEGFNKFFQNVAINEGLYAVPRKNENGRFSFETYDLEDISDRIYNQGIRPQQMSEKMNLGTIEDLERNFKPILDFSKENYMAGNKQAILELIDEGKSPEEAIDELYKKGMGTKKGLTNIFYDDAVKTQDEVLDFYDKEMRTFLPKVFEEAIDEENKRASAANLEYDKVLDSQAISDTFSPYTDKTYDNLAKDLGTENQASVLSKYGTELQYHYRDIMSNPKLTKSQKIKALRDLESLENSYEFDQTKAYNEEMEKAGMIIGPDGEWMEPNHTVRGISDEEFARNNASWNIKNPYRKASMLTKFLHPIDALGHLAKYGNTDRMQEEDPSSGIWHDNLLMQGLDAASYITPVLGQIRAAQMIADGFKGLGNIAAYDYNTPNADINKMDFLAPAINLGIGKALGGKKFLIDGLKKGVKSVDRMISPSAMRNFKFKPFTVNSSTGLNSAGKNYMSGTFDNPAFAGVGIESALIPLSFDDIAMPVMGKVFEKGYEIGEGVEDIIDGTKSAVKSLYAKGGITKGKSKIHGNGMFTTKPYKKGEVIGLAHENDEATTELGKLHNHADSPSAENIKKGNKRYLVAASDLPAGTEVTTNYRLQPELEQPEDFQKGGMTPQKDGYRTYSPFKNLPYIDVESNTIDMNNLAYDKLKLVGDNGVTKIANNNSGLVKIPGANTIREIPIAQRGGRIVKTLKEIKNELPEVFKQMHQVSSMNPREYGKFKDLGNLISTYAYSGIPSAKEAFTQQQLDTFKSIQRDRARKQLLKALDNDAVTKQDLVSILTHSQDGSALIDRSLRENQGIGTIQNKTFYKATPKIGEFRGLVEEEDAAYIQRITNSLQNLSKDELKRLIIQTENNLTNYRSQMKDLLAEGLSFDDAFKVLYGSKSPEIQSKLKNNPGYKAASLLEKPSFTPTDLQVDEMMERLARGSRFESDRSNPVFDMSALEPGEQIIGNFDDIYKMRNDIDLKQAVQYLVQKNTPEETLNDFSTKLNKTFHRAAPGSIITGALDTSADSYPMQVKRVLRAASLRRAPKIGVSETPQFLGFESMNTMGFLQRFLNQKGLGIPRGERNRIQSELLQRQLSEIYDQAKIPSEERIPIMAIPRGEAPVSYKNRTYYQGDILLPQFGVLKKDVQWPEGHKRVLLQDGGFAGVAPPPDTYPEGFRTDPRAFRGQVPRKMIREQRKANKKLMDPGMGIYGVDLEREKGVPPYNFDKQSRERNREVRQQQSKMQNNTSGNLPSGNSYLHTDLNKIGRAILHPFNADKRIHDSFKNMKFSRYSGKKRNLKDGGFVEADLNQKEIDNLVKQGYIIEDV